MSLTSEAARSRSHGGSTLVTGDDNEAVSGFFFSDMRGSAWAGCDTHEGDDSPSLE